jgi:DNA polymerase I
LTITDTLAMRIGRSELEARELLTHHKRVFSAFWAWSGWAVHEATFFGHIDLSFGWRIHHGTKNKNGNEDNSPMTLANAPVQGNGAEMMRLAAIFAHQAGITVNAPLHDAFLIEAAAEDEIDAIRSMRDCMAHASRLVLDGVEVPVKTKSVRWPDRFVDGRSDAQDMWRDAMGYLVEISRRREVHPSL